VNGLQRLQIVQAEQAAIGHQHQAAQMREALHDLLDDRQHRLGLGRVALEDLVIDRQALAGLHHAQHELTSDQALLGHAELADIAGHRGESFGANRGHVVERHRQILVDQGAQQRGDHAIDCVLVVHQRVHAAQQLLMRETAKLLILIVPRGKRSTTRGSVECRWSAF
jgi:hypothetical protein